MSKELAAKIRMSIHDIRGALTPIILLGERIPGEEGKIVLEAARDAIAECNKLRELAGEQGE